MSRLNGLPQEELLPTYIAASYPTTTGATPATMGATLTTAGATLTTTGATLTTTVATGAAAYL
jgi:hypothetical protein